MPGDPLRAKYIAETFLENPVLVNNVRGVQGYTGLWKGARVSVMASGMGIPSIGIYSWELYNQYDVEKHHPRRLRGRDFGRAAAARRGLRPRRLHRLQLRPPVRPQGQLRAIADWTLLKTAAKCAAARGIEVKAGNVMSSDNFYNDGNDGHDQWKKMGVLAVEMEAAGLYMTAARCGKRALCLCTISDHIYRPEELTPEERERSMNDMIEIALDTAAEMD